MGEVYTSRQGDSARGIDGADRIAIQVFDPGGRGLRESSPGLRPCAPTSVRLAMEVQPDRAIQVLDLTGRGLRKLAKESSLRRRMYRPLAELQRGRTFSVAGRLNEGNRW